MSRGSLEKKELVKILSKVDDEALMMDFLSNLLTPGEFEEIAKRLQIFKLLILGMPQREISERLGVSIGKISRGSRELQYGKNGAAKVLKKFNWWQEKNPVV